MAPDNAASQAKRLPWSKRMATVTLTPGVIASTGLFLLICWTSVFLLGVISGRDNIPLNTEAQFRSPYPAASPENTDKKQDIIEASELKYQYRLKKYAQVDVKPYVPPASAPARAPAATGGSPASTGENKEEKQPETLTADANQLFDYVFQLGSFRKGEGEKVDRLREQLEGSGFRTRLTRSQDRLILSLAIRGTAAVEQDVAAAAQRVKLGQPLRLQKTPVR